MNVQSIGEQTKLEYVTLRFLKNEVQNRRRTTIAAIFSNKLTITKEIHCWYTRDFKNLLQKVCEEILMD